MFLVHDFFPTGSLVYINQKKKEDHRDIGKCRHALNEFTPTVIVPFHFQNFIIIDLINN